MVVKSVSFPKEDSEKWTALEEEANKLGISTNKLVLQKLFATQSIAPTPTQSTPSQQPQTTAASQTPFEYTQKGDPLCIHDNKVIEMTFIDNEASIHLGKEVAHCKYKRLRKEFDPLQSSDDLKVCLKICQLAKDNNRVSTLALKRAEIEMRTTAKFNYEVDIMKEKQKALPGPRAAASSKGSTSNKDRWVYDSASGKMVRYREGGSESDEIWRTSNKVQRSSWDFGR